MKNCTQRDTFFFFYSRISKKILSCIFFLILINNCASLSTYSNNKTSDTSADDTKLWFPFAWQAEIDTKVIETLEIRDVTLVLRNPDTKIETFLPLKSGGPGYSRHGILSADSFRRAFYLEKLQNFKPGAYELWSVRLLIVDPRTQRPVPLEITVPNPVASDRTIRFVVHSHRIAMLPRMQITSQFIRQGTQLSSIQKTTLIDKDDLPVTLINGANPGTLLSETLLFPGSDDFPKLRWPLPLSSDAQDPRNKTPSANLKRLGFFLEFPCPLSGDLLLYWKRIGHDSESVSALAEDQICKPQQNVTTALVPLSFYWNTPNPPSDPAQKRAVSEGWQLKALQILASSKPHEFKETMNENDYFQLNQRDVFLMQQTPQKVLERSFIFQIPFSLLENKSEKNLIFAGHFVLKNDEKDGLITLYKRTFDLNKVKESFKVDRVLSAYSGEELTTSRPKGNLQIKLRTTAEESQTQRMQKDVTEVKKRAADLLSQCVAKLEIANPLITEKGNIKIRVLRGSEQLVLPADQDTPGTRDEAPALAATKTNLRDCFRDALSETRFEKLFSSTFQGEFFFTLE